MPQALLSRKMGILPSEPRRLQEPKAVLNFLVRRLSPPPRQRNLNPATPMARAFRSQMILRAPRLTPHPKSRPLLSLRVGTMLMLHGISSVAGHPSPGGIRFAAIGIGSMLPKTARWQRGGSMWPVRVITWLNPVLLKELWQRDGFATRGLGISRTSQEPFFRIGNGLVVPGIGLIRVAAARWRVGSTLLTGTSICWAIMGSQMAGCLMGRCGITAQMGKF